MARRAWILPLALAFILALSGCSNVGVINQRAAKFSSALAATTTSVRESFAAANQAHANAKLEDILVSYQRNDPVKPEIVPFVSAQQLALRMSVLEGMEAYANRLVQLTGGDPQKRFDAATDGLAKKLGDLDLTKWGVTSIPQATLDNGKAAAGKIADFLIKAKLDRELPSIIREMHPSIEKIAELLKSDIGEAASVGTLRHQLSTANTAYMQAHALFIARAKYPPAELRSAMLEFVQVRAQWQATDAAMEASIKALDKLVTAHSALVSITDTEKIDVDIALEQLAAAAKDIRGIYTLVMAAAGRV